ncbi:DUF7410 domain-containing protein [Halostella salina]|uniref:DUF7410 domain-containing protein n=1 Tax=Halostella salina TaxID=1547897 RepID=UPI001F0903D5|nr:C2H2-type zinc finger protein [Halostella salina]
MTANASPQPADDVELPADEQTEDCPYCGRPFAYEEYRTLHVGLDHPEACTEAEVEAFQAAYREESEDLRLFRLKAIGGIVLLYFGFLFTYSLVT